MALPNPLEPSQIALFLDFDGTLVQIADRPDEVRVSERTKQIVSELHVLLNGAVAIITGRDISVIDEFLAPLHLPVAGVHGSTRRDARGRVHACKDDGRLTLLVEQRIRPMLAANAGLLLETKHASVALHYRARPELESQCIKLMQSVVDELESAVLKHGKMVVEASASGGDKGTAISVFMSEPPFAGRRPVFAGDDITDEDAFKEVNALGGTSIKIGPGQTSAAWRAATTEELLDWLDGIAVRLATENRLFSGRPSG
jgi:trehalose 6-phosphate phosphatase